MSIEYKDRKWLKNKYLKENLSTYKIAKICNVHHMTISRWLNRYNIPIYSRGEATHLATSNHCKLSKKAINWINGELLGDGSLNKLSSYSARFTYTSKYLEYIKYVSTILESFGIKQVGRINKYYHRKLDCYTYSYASHSYVDLLHLYKKWYPGDKKMIPKDLELTPLVIRQWYIGDGFLKNRMQKNIKPHIILYADGFTVSNIQLIIEKLTKLGFKVTRWLSRNVICFSVHSIKDFFDYIGECPVECYQYKFSYNYIVR